MRDASPSRHREAATLVNEAILCQVRESPEGELEWEFLCECDQAHCHEHVLLTLDAYIALHDHGEVVLADGHRLSQLARARRLRAEAEALRRQAVHQLKRATTNLRNSKARQDSGHTAA